VSDVIWVALILALTLLAMTGIIAYAWWRVSAAENAQSPQAPPAPPAEPTPAPVPFKVSEPPMTEFSSSKTSITVPPEDKRGLEVDPQRLPSKKIYRPQPGSTAEPPRCVCHKRYLQPGESFIMWPVLGSPEVKVFCVSDPT
jgi:hypothetical protein